MTEKFDYDLISKDYEINGTEDDRLYLIKQSLGKLTMVERKIFLTYCELGTYSATARIYNVSSPTIKSYVTAIKNKLLNDLD